MDRHSFLIDASGPLELVQNCFSWNSVGVSPAVSYHSEESLVLSDNFAEVSRGSMCPFVGHFRTAWQYTTDSPFCYDFDVTSCQADLTVAPTLAPTQTPTTEPTAVPTNGPAATSFPTTLTPTRLGNIIATSLPSAVNDLPTLSPTQRTLDNVPTRDPEKPTEIPSAARSLFSRVQKWQIVLAGVICLEIWTIL